MSYLPAKPANFACKTINPNNPLGPKIDAIIPANLYLRYYKYYPIRYQNLRAAKYVLENPQRIFWGVRQFNEGGWCYTGRPIEWYIKENVVVAFPDDKIFAVYLNPNMRVYECRAEYAASNNPMCPDNWENRYRGLIWKSTS